MQKKKLEREIKKKIQNEDVMYTYEWSNDMSLGARLSAYRRLNRYTQDDMATFMEEYKIQHNMIKPLVIPSDATVNEEKDIADESQRRHLSYKRTYQNWEYNRTQPAYTDLKMLCEIIDCDYDFLLLDSNVPRKTTPAIESELGLSRTAIESLKKYNRIKETLEREHGKYNLQESLYLDTISHIINSPRLLSFLSYYITNIHLFPEISDSEVLDIDYNAYPDTVRFCNVIPSYLTGREDFEQYSFEFSGEDFADFMLLSINKEIKALRKQYLSNHSNDAKEE